MGLTLVALWFWGCVWERWAGEEVVLGILLHEYQHSEGAAAGTWTWIVSRGGVYSGQDKTAPAGRPLPLISDGFSQTGLPTLG